MRSSPSVISTTYVEQNPFVRMSDTYINDKQVPSDIIGEPTRIEKDQRIMYVFVIAGFVILYHISKQNIPERFIRYTIQPSNEAFIFHLPIEKGQEFLLKYFGIG